MFTRTARGEGAVGGIMRSVANEWRLKKPSANTHTLENGTDKTRESRGDNNYDDGQQGDNQQRTKQAQAHTIHDEVHT